MIEKQQADEFDESEDEDVLDAEAPEEDVELARLTRDLDLARRRGTRQGVPAWRKLELLAEQKRIAELTCDFEDYELDEPKRSGPARLRMGM